MPPWEFQIVIYLAGSSETAAGPRLAYANRYFIPVCGNKDRGWGIRWFSRGKFSVGHSDSPSGAFLVCLSFFFLLPFSAAGAVIETGCVASTFLRSRFIFPDDSFGCVPLSIWQQMVYVDLEIDLFANEFLRARVYNFVNCFIRIYFRVC